VGISLRDISCCFTLFILFIWLNPLFRKLVKQLVMARQGRVWELYLLLDVYVRLMAYIKVTVSAYILVLIVQPETSFHLQKKKKRRCYHCSASGGRRLRLSRNYEFSIANYFYCSFRINSFQLKN
jgi:hypothetical protein